MKTNLDKVFQRRSVCPLPLAHVEERSPDGEGTIEPAPLGAPAAVAKATEWEMVWPLSVRGCPGQGIAPRLAHETQKPRSLPGDTSQHRKDRTCAPPPRATDPFTSSTARRTPACGQWCKQYSRASARHGLHRRISSTCKARLSYRRPRTSELPRPPARGDRTRLG
jgi:hypothetical protein